MHASFRRLLRQRLDDAAGVLREALEFAWQKQTKRVDRRELDDHPRPCRFVESVRELFVSLLNKAEDGQVPFMMTPGIVPNEG